MEKPIIYINESFNDKQIKEIIEAAPQYEIVFSKDLLPKDSQDNIQIMLGWDQTLGEELLNSSTSQLKWVQSVSAGVDSYDLSRFHQKDILLSNGSGIHSISITEHVLGILLAETKGIRQSIQQQQNQVWSNDTINVQQLSGQKMLIVGTGQIGQKLAYFSQGIGLQTYGINTNGHSVNGFIECYSQDKLTRIIKEMDIVVNILPYTKETYHLYNTTLFQSMKKGSIFVNVGRGPSVNTDSLIKSLLDKHIKFAALDVFEEEPLPKNSPLWQMDNVLITPHISGLTPKFKTKLLAIFLPNLTSFINSGILIKNQIALDKGY